MPYRAAIEKLSRDLMIMAEMCERSIDTAIMALIDCNEDMALSVVSYDEEIDEMELSTERDCLAILAEPKLNQEGRRFVTTAIKINLHLERIGDHAVEIAKHVIFLARERSILAQLVEFGELVEQIEQILRESVGSLVERDVALARKVVEEHAVVSDELGHIIGEIIAVIQQNPKIAERAMHILLVAASLARVADLAMNLAEEVVFLISGESVRHAIHEIHPVHAVASAHAGSAPLAGASADEAAAVRMARETRTMRRKKK